MVQEERAQKREEQRARKEEIERQQYVTLALDVLESDPQIHRYSQHIMEWEPLTDIPEDLQERWCAIPVPLGAKRCLVISAKGTR